MQQITLTQSQIETITSNNYTKSQIKEYLKISFPTVDVVCNKYGITPSRDQRKYKPNDNYFKTWSIEMAYFLGLIAADGHVSHKKNLLMINLKQTDRQIIENLKNALEYDGPIYTINKKDGQPQSCLTVSSKEIAKDLNDLGLSGNKTYDFDWVVGMPEKYVSHFIRGLLDGDGNIYINQNKQNFSSSIVGTYKLTQNIKDHFEKFTNKTCGHLQAKGAVQNLVFNGRYNALAFLNWIYTDSTQSTRLSRKYELYLQLKDTICAEEQVPNNSHINQEIANEIRSDKHRESTSKEIANKLEISEHIVNDVKSNRTWIDESYAPTPPSNTILITHDNQIKTIQEWSDELGIPYSTIDRRHRMGLPSDQILDNSGKRLSLGKTQSEKEKQAYELAFNLRTDYKNGLKGKALYEEKYGIKKSRYIDIIGNRTCKEGEIWWSN
jgi:DNA-binding CsgD family transcriptional regulator